MTKTNPSVRVVVLTGPMGAGKSAVAALLAKELHGPFFDTDKVIEEQSGHSIAEIFAMQGESAFRSLESETCVNLIQNAETTSIIALGGGAFMDEAIRNACLQDDVLSIYLHTSPEESWSRVRRSAGGAAKRPLLAHPDPVGRLQSLYKQRHPVYQEAKWTVETDERLPEQVVQHILSQLLENNESQRPQA